LDEKGVLKSGEAYGTRIMGSLRGAKPLRQ